MPVGLYSAGAAKKFGTSFYSTPDGREVEVTAIGDPAKYKWPDARIIGPVDRWLRLGQRGDGTLKMEWHYR